MADQVVVLDGAGLVVNVVLAGDDWSPGEGFSRGPAGGGVGDRWDGTKYVKPPRGPIAEVAPPDPVAALQAELAELKAELQFVKENAVAKVDLV